MNSFVLVLTLFGMFIPVYVYIGYPVFLFTLVKAGKGKPHKIDEKYLPKVTLLVSCYNEVDVVHEKIANTLAINYPSEKFEIIFISDGSDDGTDEAIKEYANQGIKLIRQEGRLGKTSAINMAMLGARGEMIVFSDANAMYKPNAVQKLVRNFADENVGYVVGAALYTDGAESSASASEDTYWKYEVALKKLESTLHSVVGGDGAIYAIRKELYIPLDAKDINDFVNPLQIIAQGYRGVFDEEAICLEETAGDFGKEAKRKERIVNRSFRGLMKVKEVLNPLKFGFFSFEVISHKLLRWLIPVFLLIIASGSAYLSGQGVFFFQGLIILELLFTWLAIIGFLKVKNEKIHPVFFFPYYFLMVNWYSLVGIVKALMGDIQVTWNSPRVKDQTRKNVTSSYFLITAFLLFSLMMLQQIINQYW